MAEFIAKILLAEDEEHLQDAIKLNLNLEGYEVVVASNGQEALEIFKLESFDLLILDVMMPLMDGFEVCKQVRKLNVEIPILFLTARDASEDRVRGLKIGADDYLPKPFNLEEFLLRVKVLLKRSSKTTISDIFTLGNSQVNFTSFEVSGVKNQKITLSKKEILFLKLLIENKNKVLSRNQILDEVWGKDAFPTSRTIDNYILGFRKLFEDDSKNPKHFLSIRSVGYKFVE